MASRMTVSKKSLSRSVNIYPGSLGNSRCRFGQSQTGCQRRESDPPPCGSELPCVVVLASTMLKFDQIRNDQFRGDAVWNSPRLSAGSLRFTAKDRVVPFSCKGRGWCPSCGGRRMADTAAHLVDRVLPWVPVRQWVLSLPFALRYRMAYDSVLMADVLTVFARAVFGELRQRARESLGIGASQCGAVTFVQRFGSALNLNIHFHMLALDGVYVSGTDGYPEFHALTAPENEEVIRLTVLVARRILAMIERRRGADEDALSRDEPGLAALYAASVRGRIAAGPHAGNRVGTLGDQIDGDSLDALTSPRCASVDGFSVHANVGIGARDRQRLERLCRYAARPPVANERLSELANGKLSYELKRPWSNGATHVVFEPQDLIAKLAALVPAPRVHMARYHGVLSSAAAWRPMIIPQTPVDTHDGALSPSRPADSSSDLEPKYVNEKPPVNPRPRNYSWAQLMKRVFAIDVLLCPDCGGQMRILAAIHPPDTTRRILDCLGLPSRAPPVHPAVLESNDQLDTL